MNKFRKWFFKFLTGHDLVEYFEIVDSYIKSLDKQKELIDLCDEVNSESKSTIALAREVNNMCGELIERCKGIKANENSRNN